MNTYQNHPDDLLIHLVQTGDTKAFEQIYARYAPAMFNFVRKNIAVKEECQEILQDIFASLWRNRAQLSHVLVLRSYLYQAARNRIAKYIKTKGIAQTHLEHYRLHEVVHTVMPEADAPEGPKAERIISLLRELPDRCRQTMELRLLENLSNKQIAQRMDITLKAVEKHIARAFTHLRKLIPQEGE